MPALEAAHGAQAVAEFLRAWQRWRAIDKRGTVLFGHADNRNATSGGARGEVAPSDLEEAFLRHRYAYGEGWPVPVERRLAEVHAWLAEEATQPQRALFDSLRENPTALESQRGTLADLLAFFYALLSNKNRLPTRDELRAVLYANRKLDAAERQAFKRALKALGLESLPTETLLQPLPAPDETEPFDVLTGQA
ncbi:MAG: hypothetical protein WEB53_09870 [Akkermansiaceae bacterium]